MFQQWQETMQRFSKDWEQASAGWWEQALRDPKTLEQMKACLDGACAAKERTDRSLEEHWAQWRLPSATDVERVYERLGEVQNTLGRIDERLAALESNSAAPTPTPRKAGKSRGKANS